MSKKKDKNYTKVMGWTVTVAVKDKDQLKAAIKALHKNGLSFSFKSYIGTYGEEYSLTVECSWATNLVWLAKILEKSDAR